MQIAWLTQSLTIKKHVRVLALVGLLGLALFVIAIKAHSFCYFWLICVRTCELIFLLLFFTL